MKRYQVQQRGTALYAGTVDLTRAQAEPRLAQLTGHVLAKAHQKVGAKSEVRAAYGIDGEVQFKVGEVLGYDGDVPKALQGVLVCLDAVESAEDLAQRVATQQHNELVAAMAGITGDNNGNIALDELLRLLNGRINFVPTSQQLEAAWAEHVA